MSEDTASFDPEAPLDNSCGTATEMPFADETIGGTADQQTPG